MDPFPSLTGTLTHRWSEYVASFALVYDTNPTQSLAALGDRSPSPFCILSTAPYCLHDRGVVSSDVMVIVANLGDHPDPRGFCPTNLRFISLLALHCKLQGSSLPESNFGFGLQRFLLPQCKTPSPLCQHISMACWVSEVTDLISLGALLADSMQHQSRVLFFVCVFSLSDL